MRFVENDRIILFQLPIALRFSQETTISHELNPRVCGRFFIKAHLITHQSAKWLFQLFGDPARHADSCDPPRLRHPNEAHFVSVNFTQSLSDHLGQLGRFSRTRLAHHHDHIVCSQGR